MKTFIALAVATVVHIVPGYANGQDAIHTGYWKFYTPTGESFPCQGVESRSSMLRVLRDAGWEEHQGYPPINWDEDEAVVISPSKYYENYELKFFGLNFDEERLVLAYGWRREAYTESADTHMSRSPTDPATIVVAYKRGVDSGYRFVCREK